MAAKIYIVSGFLGAGKTTLIQKMIGEAFLKDKTVIVENDFGEASVDAALLGSGGAEVAEINSGCICCNLSGDFIDSLKGLLKRFKPDRVIIEPSGVAKLSDVAEACSDGKIAGLAEVCKKITVVDATRCKKYLDNFGEFFEDQIRRADVILLNRAEESADKTAEALNIVGEINKDAPVFKKPWDRLRVSEILSPAVSARSDEHGHGDPLCCDGHDHSADDFFDTVTLRPGRAFSAEDLKNLAAKMEGLSSGVLRAKGIVRGESGYLNLQYVPGDIKIEDAPTAGDIVCFIGRDLNRAELAGLFRDGK
ncbi:MAG: GTP-binding protein [Synergistaceae bacterium]|jgi:G3E family GTPase|nr:GTP-binding protein [Synergistaceae bacterium]